MGLRRAGGAAQGSRGGREPPCTSMGCGVRPCKGTGSNWALGRLGEDRRWYCSRGHPCRCPRTMVALPFLPPLSCPPVCPHPCGERASRLSPRGRMRGSRHRPRMAGQPAERKRILMVFVWKILVGRRKGRVALFLTRAGCQLCKKMATVVRAVVLRQGWLALKPNVSHENKRPAVPAPRWPSGLSAQVCMDVLSQKVQPAQALPM